MDAFGELGEGPRMFGRSVQQLGGGNHGGVGGCDALAGLQEREGRGQGVEDDEQLPQAGQAPVVAP